MVTASSEVVNYRDRHGLCMANSSMLCHHCVDQNTRFNALGRWPNTWCASSKATIDRGGTEWIQVDFGATVATVLAVEIQGRYPGAYWGNVRSMGFEVQSSACAQDPVCDLWTPASVGEKETFAGAANQLSERKYTKTFDKALTGSKFRIIIKGYRNYPSMSWDLVGFIPPTLGPSPPPPSPSPPPPSPSPPSPALRRRRSALPRRRRRRRRRRRHRHPARRSALTSRMRSARRRSARITSVRRSRNARRPAACASRSRRRRRRHRCCPKSTAAASVTTRNAR